jgi:hypothetical protein
MAEGDPPEIAVTQSGHAAAPSATSPVKLDLTLWSSDFDAVWSYGSRETRGDGLQWLPGGGEGSSGGSDAWRNSRGGRFGLGRGISVRRRRGAGLGFVVGKNCHGAPRRFFI